MYKNLFLSKTEYYRQKEKEILRMSMFLSFRHITLDFIISFALCFRYKLICKQNEECEEAGEH